jgi:hypothetical protein
MNRETLKQAIAEAKTIKETAIANAKLALEEAFTPQLTAMFAEKLNELEEEEEKMEESVEENYSMEEEGLEETFNIDEILAELEMTEEAEEIEEADDMKEELDEELMLEEMSDEEIEELVTQVIDDMIASGKLMAGEESEEEESEEEMDMDDMEMDAEEESEEEVNLDELLAEMEEMEEGEEVKEEMVSEALSPEITAVLAAFGLPIVAASVSKLSDMAKAGKLGMAGTKIINFLEKAGKATAPRNTGGGDLPEAKEMEETINELRNELNEVNLLNAKLLYTNKIFRAKNLTESEKVKVLNTFDKATNVKEVKLVFETLTESLKAKTAKPSPIKESLGSASKTITPATPKQPIVEVNEAFARMQRLAGIK